MAKVKKRTFRVKQGFGPHQILVGGKRETIEPGETFKDTSNSRNVTGWENKLEIIEDGDVVEVAVTKEEEEVEEAKAEHIEMIKEHVGGGYYNVYNKITGKKINSKPLTKANADKLLVGEEVKEKPKKKKRTKI